MNDNGDIDIDEFSKHINIKTKIIAFTHISNVTGAILPVKKIIDLATIKKHTCFNRWNARRTSCLVRRSRPRL